VLAAAAGALLLCVPSAFGHAYLERSVPAAGAVTERSPSTVVLAFDETVAPAGVDVRRQGGGSVVRAPAFERRGHPNEIAVPLRAGLPAGGYVVRWRVVDTADGHVIAGSFSFAVGSGSRPPAVAVTRGGDFRGDDAAGRWLLLSGLLLAAGIAAFRRLVWRGDDERWQRSSALSLAAALAAAAAGAAVLLALQPDPLGTRFAKLTLAGAVVAAVAAGAALASLRRPRMGAVAEAAAVLLLALPTVSGHAVARGSSHLLSVPADLVHLAAAAVWTGGVFCLVVVAPLALPPAERRHALASLTRRFARVAAVAVVALAATGVLRALGELHAVSQLWTLPYGRALLVKTGLLVTLVALAAAARGRPRGRLLVVELGLLAAAVGAVAVLTASRPGRDAVSPAAAGRTDRSAFVVGAPAGDLAVGLAVTPRGESSVEARATVLAASGPVSGLDVRLRVSGSWVRATPCGAGCYSAQSALRGRPTALAARLVRPGRAPLLARFRVPEAWPAPTATTIVRRAAQAFRELRTLTFTSRLASSPTNATTTLWRLQAPDRLSYRELETGSESVIVGARRWDRTGPKARWSTSPQAPVHQPSPPWPRPFRSAHLLGSGTVGGRSVWIVSFLDPATPSWFTIAVDKETYRTLWVDMIATAHFMVEHYRGFDAPIEIVPPVR
jgi:copper transport protein